MDREFLFRLEDELTRARYEIDEKYQMGIEQLRAALKDVPGSESFEISYQDHDGSEIYTINGRRIRLGPDQTVDDAVSEYLRSHYGLANPFEGCEKPTMSITDAGKLAGTIKDRINSAKARIAEVAANTDGALAKLNDAADTGDKIAKQIEKEASDLLAEIGQFDNGGPAL